MTPRQASSIQGTRIVSGPGALAGLVAGLRTSLPGLVSGSEAQALVLLAVEEAAVNVLEHGYAGGAGGPLALRICPRSGTRFEIRLRDRAPVVDVTRIPPGDLKELARRRASRGRGLALIHMLTESLEHRPRAGGGNELCLRFDADQLRRIIETHFRDAA